MKSITEVKKALFETDCLNNLAYLYCCDEEAAGEHAKRYAGVLESLEEEYGPHGEAALFSAPGRTEIGGNHTDHQHGCVLAGSVNIDMIAAVAPNSLNQLRLKSEGYDPCTIDLTELEKRAEEENTSLSILRGSCRAYADRGAKLSGLDVYVVSRVPKGSGVSSSAAFEVLVGTILNELFMDSKKCTPIEIAQIGQWVENVYFGKPCGLMDQAASSVGGLIGIDFQDPAKPVVTQIPFDPAEAGLALCILDSGADHADLTDEYTAIPVECRSVAALLGGEVLRDVSEEEFYRQLPSLRGRCSDRALMRAIHIFQENERAKQEVAALAREDYEQFLSLVNESGHSSWEQLQNVTPAGAVDQQAVALTISVARHFLSGRGAVRVHGGGFAGTVQAFVPLNIIDEFHQAMDAALGEGSCHVMFIRPVGGTRVL